MVKSHWVITYSCRVTRSDHSRNIRGGVWLPACDRLQPIAGVNRIPAYAVFATPILYCLLISGTDTASVRIGPAASFGLGAVVWPANELAVLNREGLGGVFVRLLCRLAICGLVVFTATGNEAQADSLQGSDPQHIPPCSIHVRTIDIQAQDGVQQESQSRTSESRRAYPACRAGDCSPRTDSGSEWPPSAVLTVSASLARLDHREGRVAVLPSLCDLEPTEVDLCRLRCIVLADNQAVI